MIPPGALSGHQAVQIPAGPAALDGDLCIPVGSSGLVLFAHGSGSSRHSPRNVFVATELQRLGLATLLMDLLTPQEELVDNRTARLRFDINLLAQRLVAATDWLGAQNQTRTLRIGCFGASTGAGAALAAAAQRPVAIAAVVSRGGRPDLAADALPLVKAPTLLIIGGADIPVIQMNRTAAAQLRVPHAVEIIPGATHLFHEPGALERVAALAGQWFTRYLMPA